MKKFFVKEYVTKTRKCFCEGGLTNDEKINSETTQIIIIDQ